MHKSAGAENLFLPELVDQTMGEYGAWSPMPGVDPFLSRVYRAGQREMMGSCAKRRAPESQCWQGFLRILPGHALRLHRFPKPGVASSILAEGASRNARVQRVPTLRMGSRRRGPNRSIAHLYRATSTRARCRPPTRVSRYPTESGCTVRRVREMHDPHRGTDRGREDNPSLAERDPTTTADTTPAPDRPAHTQQRTTSPARLGPVRLAASSSSTVIPLGKHAQDGIRHTPLGGMMAWYRTPCAGARPSSERAALGTLHSDTSMRRTVDGADPDIDLFYEFVQRDIGPRCSRQLLVLGFPQFVRCDDRRPSPY